jgi:hypothetical protein
MKNLEDVAFYRILKENSGGSSKFYCSTITKKFIQTCDKYAHLSDLCQEVTSESPFIVNISQKETVTVTFCGSGHCPGSVMVFIEGLRGNVLFTGDFRLPMGCASRLMFFKEKCSTQEIESGKNVTSQTKSLENLYIDMTFFKPEIKYIPTREESVQSLIQFIKSFIKPEQPDKTHMPNNKEYFTAYIYLKTSARIGYEYVYQEINRHTGLKVHVNELIYKIYDQLPAIQSALTLDPYSTPIHACIYENKKRDQSKTDLMSPSVVMNEKNLNQTKMKKSYLATKSDPASSDISSKFKPLLPCCCDLGGFKVNCVKIILSAMWFTDTAGVDKIFVRYAPSQKELATPAYKPYEAIYRLLFSFHSSFEEIIDFVNVLRPKRLHPIALPDSTSEQLINEYFYSFDTKAFQGFHNNRAFHQRLKNSNSNNNNNNESAAVSSSSLRFDGTLLLRKRTCDSFTSLILEKSSGEESLNNSGESLLFDYSDEDNSTVKKLKK